MKTVGRLVLLAWIFALSSAAAFPARADDMALRWDDCGASGASLATFACDTNAGTNDLVVSFSLSGPRSLSAFEAILEVVYPGPAPSWWTVPGCRPYGVFGVSAGSGFTGCVSPWAASATGGASFEPTFFAPSIGRLRAGMTVPLADSASLAADVEYAAVRISLSHVKTTGTGSCAGCTGPAGFYLRTVQCYSPFDTQPHEIFPLVNDDPRYFVVWQCEGTPHFDGSFVDGWSFENCSVGTNRTTWGAVKSLYR